MEFLTKKELEAVKQLKKAYKALPNTIQVYGLDDSLIICKKGVKSTEFSETIGYGINCTSMLTDVRIEDGGVDM